MATMTMVARPKCVLPTLISKALIAAKDSTYACPDTGCGVKVYWRDAFLRLPFFTSMHRYLPALFQTYGHEVAYVSVNDRPRQAGVSKYNNINRALVGLYDLIGVTWLRRRTKIPEIVDMHPERRVIAPTVGRATPKNFEGKKLSAAKTC